MVPLSGFVAIGALAAWDAIAGGSWARRGVRIAAAVALAAIALLPAARFDGRVLADPVHASYPGLDHVQYVTANSAQTWVVPVARRIEQGGGPYPVHIDVGRGYPWGLDLELNGATYGKARRYDVFANGKPAERARARYFIRDGPGGLSVPPGLPADLELCAQRRRRRDAALRALVGAGSGSSPRGASGRSLGCGRGDAHVTQPRDGVGGR